jgi:voltage-gated potassium channel
MFASFRASLEAHRYKVLLWGLLVVLVFGSSSAGDEEFGQGAVAIGFSLPVMAVLASLGSRTRVGRYLAALLAFAALSTSSVVATGMLTALQSGALFVNVAFLVLTTSFVFVGVFRSPRVTGDVLAGALAGYMLLAFTWGATFALIEATHRHSFAATSAALPHALTYSDLVYFAFIGMLSIGFGDIVPLTPIARALVVCAGLTGVAFNTIVLALLVSKYLAHSEGSPG